MPARVLVVEGNPKRVTDEMVRLGGRPYAESYAALLESLAPDIECDTVTPSEDGPDCLPAATRTEDYDGIAWTGSAMSAYEDRPEVQHQRVLAERAFASGVPVFGSCWGLQIMVVALGGVVRKNPKGREIGIAEEIALTEAGAAHPMFGGRAGAFEAFAVHMDEVSELPDGSVVLAGNDMSDVQAMVIDDGTRSFWGVQYHPEFTFHTMSVIIERLRPRLVEEGIVESDEAARAWSESWRMMDNAAHEFSSDITDTSRRYAELRTWLQHKVLPSTAGVA